MADLRVAAADGAELAVTVAGDGPALLLIPGLGATRVVFDPLLPFLVAHRRVVVYDQRGIGESAITPGPYTTAQLAADAAAVLDALDVDRTAVLGASFGGMVAQQLAVGHQRRLSALLLAATGPGRAHLLLPPDPEAGDALLGRGARTPEEAYRRACTVLYSTRFQHEQAGFIEQQVRDRARRPIAARAFQAQLAASRDHDAWDGLTGIRVPTLVMHGSEDLVMPAANARAVAERIPGARYLEFEGAGHLFFHEVPAAAAAAIIDFTDGFPG